MESKIQDVIAIARANPAMRLIFVCKYCKAKFNEAHHLISHKKENHPVEVSQILVRQKQRNAFVEEKISQYDGEPLKVKLDGKANVNEENLELKTAKENKIKVSNKSDKNNFGCRFCDRKFPNTSYRYQHEQGVHSGQRPHKCRHCGMTFAWRHCWVRHERNCNNQNRRRRRNNSVLKSVSKKPSVVKTDIQKFKLQLHNSRSRSKSATIKRNRMENTLNAADGSDTPYLIPETLNGRSAYKCFFCAKVMQNKYDATIHTRVHTGEKPFKCLHCNDSFSSKQRLGRHENVVHSINKTEMKESEIPKPKLSQVQKPDRQKSKSKVLKIDEKLPAQAKIISSKPLIVKQCSDGSYLCNVCKAKLKSLQSLRRHFIIHSGQKPHKCSYCEKAFSCSTSLRDHEAIHLGIRRHFCKYCNKSFLWSSSKLSHQRKCELNVE